MFGIGACCRNGVVLIGLVAILGGSVPVSWAADGDAIAIVDGQPISKQRLVEVLMESHGLAIMQQLIALELAKAETGRLKISVSKGDVDAEFERALAKIAPEANAAGESLNDEQRHKALDIVLEQRGVSLAEFNIGMERNAHLRKVVQRDFVIDEATLREEFARQYGEKVEIRHIQVGAIAGLHEALDRLGKGDEFAEVARQVSENADSAANGGLMAPFSFSDEEIPAMLREAAFSMGAGQVSKPLRVGRFWHILRMERRLAASGVCLDDVRAEVEQSLRERVIPREMNRVITELYEKAQIRVLDGELRRKYRDLIKENGIGQM